MPNSTATEPADFEGDPRIAALFEEFLGIVEYFVDVVSDYKADFVVFPELFSLQLLSIDEERHTPREAIEALTAWDHRIDQPLHETYEDEDAWPTMLAGQIRFLMDVIDGTGAPVTGGQLERLADLQAEWSKRLAELEAIGMRQLEPINAWARDRGVEHVPVPVGPGR